MATADPLLIPLVQALAVPQNQQNESHQQNVQQCDEEEAKMAPFQCVKVEDLGKGTCGAGG